MSKILDEGYRDFIARKWEKGQYFSIIERLTQANRIAIYEQILELLLTQNKSIENDEEFMDRVGNILLKRQTRQEKNLEII